jgi:hypothetical protein
LDALNSWISFPRTHVARLAPKAMLPRLQIDSAHRQRIRNAEFHSAVPPSCTRQGFRELERLRTTEHHAEYNSAIGSFAPAHSGLRPLPSLRSGNPFRRLTVGSSQQSETLRYTSSP